MTYCSGKETCKLSIVIPCYNEEKTLKKCINHVLEIADDNLSLEIIVVDDHSTDTSYSIAREIEKNHSEIKVLRHEKNLGKGAALRTGFKYVTGDYVAVQDADLEYDPNDLKDLLGPLKRNEAHVVIGSRFLTADEHRVLYFWHYMGNRFLTFLSNMFTDLNLSDMESCYKVFRREIIQAIDIKEERFGFEPEIVAKIAHMRLRIFEKGISYNGRTYEEGKKIGVKDGFRALYCIFRYNAHRAPIPIQFLIYLFIGSIAAAFNFIVFMLLYQRGLSINLAAPLAFIIAATLNYLLCIAFLFRHRAKWSSFGEIFAYAVVVLCVAAIDLLVTYLLHQAGLSVALSKIGATVLSLMFNFFGRRLLVFPEPSSGSWSPR